MLRVDMRFYVSSGLDRNIDRSSSEAARWARPRSPWIPHPLLHDYCREFDKYHCCGFKFLI